jgi:S-adenosylmethionine hydrolase
VVKAITLTTDFGSRDAFVGTMKGVILSLNPRATVVDLVHELKPGDVRGGAFSLLTSYRFFPKGTIHVVVVDPGVGSKRTALAVKTGNFCFLGPNNGVLSWALAKEKILEIRALENEKLFLKDVSRTFHGRDVFAPVAAHLSKGVPFKKLGPVLKDFDRLEWPAPLRKGKEIRGEFVYIDRFGNAITNIAEEDLRLFGKGEVRVSVGRGRTCPLASFYQAVPDGKPVAVPGSSGFLEIAINGGSAKKSLGLATRASVVLMETHNRSRDA